MSKKILITLIFGVLICLNPVSGQKKKETANESEKKENGLSSTFSGLSFRSIGPAWSSGRISGIAVNPENHSEIYAGVAAEGSIWEPGGEHGLYKTTE